MARQRAEAGIVPIPRDVPIGKRREVFQPLREPPAKERIAEHREERRGERDGDPPRRPALGAALEHAEEREITFEEGLVQPPLFERVLELGMPDERQMRVKENRKIPGGRATRAPRCLRQRGVRLPSARVEGRALRRHGRPPGIEERMKAAREG